MRDSGTPLASLTECSVGESRALRAIEGPDLLVERLYEIGFLPGEVLRVQGKMPFGGPWLVEVRGTTVALRENEAQCLKV